MSHQFALAAVVLLAVSLSACKRNPADLPAPVTELKGVATLPASSSETAVTPNYSSASGPAPSALPAPTGERVFGDTGPTKGSNAVPMPGMNHDHSAPKPSDEPASSPKTPG